MMRDFVKKTFLLSCLLLHLPTLAEKNRKSAYSDKIESFIHQMSDEEKIAQLFAIGIRISKKDYDQIFEVFFPGGFVEYRSFKSNKAFYKKWFEERDHIQEMSFKKTNLPPLYMANQEGGDVSRFKRDFFIQDQKYTYWDVPGPLKMTQAKDLKRVEELARELGRLLLIVGINMNLAPVVDITSSEENEYIRWRSFGSDPYEVQKISQAFTAGLQKAGVISTFKHFPGYTQSKLNSHNSFVTIPLPKQAFRDKYWIPYKMKPGKATPKVVMSNIAFYPQLEDQSTAPLSKKIITGILKQELGYKGLVITDDIGMYGYKEPKLSERAIRSLLAGHDMIIHSVATPSDVIRTYKEVLNAFKKGRIPEAQVDNSLRKILSLKMELPHSQTYKLVPPLETRIQQINASWKRLYYINQKLTRSLVNSFFKENPHLKQSLSRELTVVSFSEESYQAIESLKYFKKHEKDLNYIRSRDRIRHSNPKDQISEQKKLSSQKTNFGFSDKKIGFCYGKIAKYCHLYFSQSQKKHIIVIDTKNKPLTPKLRKQYKLYIPTYGASSDVGEMFLKPMIQAL